jgi:hypothetical protein
MKLRSLFFAVLLTPAGAAFAQTFDDKKVIVEFIPGTDISSEIVSANAYLEALPSDSRIESDFDTEHGKTELELNRHDAVAVTALVEQYFPADPNVVSVSYAYEDDNSDELSGEDSDSDDAPGGTSVRVTVTLTKAAPRGGARVRLSSSTSSAQVPATVTIPAGRKSASFMVRTRTVTRNTRARITASYKARQTASFILIRKR